MSALQKKQETTSKLVNYQEFENNHYVKVYKAICRNSYIYRYIRVCNDCMKVAFTDTVLAQESFASI